MPEHPFPPKTGSSADDLRRGSRLVLATFGSLGDLFPFIALGRELKARGHCPVIASCASFQEHVEAAGLEFRPVRPDLAAFKDRPQLIHNPPSLWYEIMLPNLRQWYDDLRAVSVGADLMVSHGFVRVAPVVADSLDLPRVDVSLVPSAIWSSIAPPVISDQPLANFAVRHSRLFARWASAVGRWSTRAIQQSLNELRAAVGLPPARQHPAFGGSYSPLLNLALFSRVLAQPQPDWPPNTLIAGCTAYDGATEQALAPEVEAFLRCGSPPLIFVLGSNAILNPGDFFSVSAEAARLCRRRALLVTGASAIKRDREAPSDDILCIRYAPYPLIFGRAAAIVHQGGIGTLTQALIAGRPMLVVPFVYDQFDNADRAVRLGVARTIPRDRYTTERVTRALQELLGRPAYAQRAEDVARQIRAEDGVGVACDAIEECLCRKRNHSI